MYLPDLVWLILNNQEKTSARGHSNPRPAPHKSASRVPPVGAPTNPHRQPAVDMRRRSVRMVTVRRTPLCRPTRSAAALLRLSTTSTVSVEVRRHWPGRRTTPPRLSNVRRHRRITPETRSKHAQNVGKTKEPPRRGGSSTSSDFWGLCQSVESASRTALALDTRASLLQAVEIPAMETAMAGLVDEVSADSVDSPSLSLRFRPLPPDGAPSSLTFSTIAARFAEGTSFDFGRMLKAEQAVHLPICSAFASGSPQVHRATGPPDRLSTDRPVPLPGAPPGGRHRPPS
jgi:hypothetical protein